VPHNAAAANANIKMVCHGADCRSGRGDDLSVKKPYGRPSLGVTVD